MTSECQKCEEKNEAMTEAELLRALGATQTMPELDALRLASVRCMQSAGEAEGEAGFKRVQNHFIKAKNRLTRIPLRDREVDIECDVLTPEPDVGFGGDIENEVITDENGIELEWELTPEEREKVWEKVFDQLDSELDA